MRVVRVLLIGVAALIAILVLVAYLLPREVTVMRQTVIEAPPESVFPWVSSLQKAAEWSPWMGLDPDLQVTYEGPPEGVGNKMSWVSQKSEVGSGTQEITASVPNEKVETALDFGDMGVAKAAILLSPEGNGTKVTWTLVSDMGMNPMGRYIGLMLDSWVGKDYEKGLANLKLKVEGG